MTKFFAGLAAAAVLAAPTFAVAGGEGKKFSRADFDACNQQAMMIAGVETGAPAASPATEGPATTTPGTTGAPAASPGAGTTDTDRAGTGAAGTGATAGVTGERVGDQADLDRIVDAYRDCLQARK